VAPGHRTSGRGAHRSGKTPLRRGAAVVAVAGGAISLVAAAAPPLDVAPLAQARLADSAVGDESDNSADSAVGDAVTTDAAAVGTTAAPDALAQPEVAGPHVLGRAQLVKAAQAAEQAVTRVTAERAAQAKAAKEAAAQEQAAQEQAAREATAGVADCGLDESGLGAVKSHVRTATEFLGCQYDEPSTYGVAGRAGTSDHPLGRAVDFMVDRATGDDLAACALENMDALGVKYVIWEQRINHGSGWEAMEDRGGATANHFDHVHVSFESGAGDGAPGRC
jgi:hypothetical protein